MKIDEILTVKGNAVHSISPEATLQEVVNRLIENRIGALVVCRRDAAGNEELAGIITDRDILYASRHGPPAAGRGEGGRGDDHRAGDRHARRRSGAGHGLDDQPAHPPLAGAGRRPPGGHHLHRRRGQGPARPAGDGEPLHEGLHHRLMAFQLRPIHLDAQAVPLRHGDHAVGDLEGIGQHRIAELAGGDFVGGGEGGRGGRQVEHGGRGDSHRGPAAQAAGPRRPPRPRRRRPGRARSRPPAPGRSPRRGPRCSARRSARRPGRGSPATPPSGTLVCRPSAAIAWSSGAFKRIEKELQSLELQSGAEVAGGFRVEAAQAVEPQFDPVAHHLADGPQVLEVFVGPAAGDDGLRVKTLLGQFPRDLGDGLRVASGQPDRDGHPPPIISAQQIAQRLPQHAAQQVPDGHLDRRPQRRRRERLQACAIPRCRRRFGRPARPAGPRAARQARPAASPSDDSPQPSSPEAVVTRTSRRAGRRRRFALPHGDQKKLQIVNFHECLPSVGGTLACAAARTRRVRTTFSARQTAVALGRSSAFCRASGICLCLRSREKYYRTAKVEIDGNCTARETEPRLDLRSRMILIRSNFPLKGI